MRIQQFVMAYGAEQDRLRAILPEGFASLRPVLRINGELRGGHIGCLEFNTAVERNGVRGWLNIGAWEAVPFTRQGKTISFQTELLEISFTLTGLQGGCPAERDNDGCFYSGAFRPAEQIQVPKEFCDCSFRWKLPGGAQGRSIGKTLPAIPTPVKISYPKAPFTVENAARIPCQQVLGSYCVSFHRIV